MPNDVRVTVVVVTWQGADLLDACLSSLRDQTVPHRLLVVDNGSTDGTAGVLKRFSEAQVLQLERNLGFAGAAQAALMAVATEFTALLNNDATADPGWLRALVDTADRSPDAAAVTSRMRLADTATINNAGIALTRALHGRDRGGGVPDGPRFWQAVEVFGFSGGAALLRTAPARAAGGFPPPFFLYYEDTDLSWRLRRHGHRILYSPGALVHHQHMATSGRDPARLAFYNQRNQLLTVIRNAPMHLVAFVIARFVAVTVALALRRAVGAGDEPPSTHRLRHRLRVLAATAGLLPWALRERRAINAQAQLDARSVLHGWPGREQRPL